MRPRSFNGLVNAYISDRMIEQPASLAVPRARVPHTLWGWAMLLIVLLSAAPTGGALRTQAFGSAFDPATYSVTTGPRRAPAPAELRQLKGTPDDTRSLEYVLPVAAAVLPSGLVVLLLSPSSEWADLSGPANLLAHHRAARGPPSI